jgi:hypothetical protein
MTDLDALVEMVSRMMRTILTLEAEITRLRAELASAQKPEERVTHLPVEEKKKE